MNTLVIRQLGEIRQFRLFKGGYHLEGKQLSISVETRADQWEAPYYVLISLVNYPIGEAALETGARFTFNDDHATTGWDDENTHANVYYDFHAEKVKLTVEVLAAAADTLTVRLSVATEHYRQGNRNSKPNPILGVFQLPQRPKSELWIPT